MLNPHQKIAVEHSEWPLLILAGAGAGKTHTLTERIAIMIREKGIRPDSILAVTFTNKAAKEMRERIAHKLEVTFSPTNPYRQRSIPVVGTFHSVGVFFLRMFGEKIGLPQNFTILDEDDKNRVVKSCLEAKNLSDKEFPPRAIAGMISGSKNEWLTPEQFRNRADSYVKSVAADIYKEYSKKLREMNAIDFDDILLMNLELMRNPEVLEYFHERFRYIMVDEYQDTNEIQYQIVKALASKHRNLAVVGDDWQGIYSWRGANIQNILHFEKDYPDATVVKLEQNYRSTKTVISAANAIIKHNVEALDKTLWTDNEEGEKIVLLETMDEKDEAKQVANRIDKAVKSGAKNSDFAILYRTNGQSRLIEEALIRKGIAYRVYGGVKFYERKEIKDILCYLRLLYNPRDLVSFRRIVNTPSRKLGDKSVDGLVVYMAENEADFMTAIASVERAEEVGSAAKRGFVLFADMWQTFLSYAREHSVRETMEYIIKTVKYDDYLKSEYPGDEAEEKMGNLVEFANMASRYDGLDPNEAITLFLEDIALITDSDRDGENDSVSLMTVHLAKGLEFSHVFIMGMEEWMFPHSRSLLDPKAIEEERRLAYVALTRAKKSAVLSRARERYTFGNYSVNPASRFLKEIPEDLMVREMSESDFKFGSGSSLTGGLSGGGSAFSFGGFGAGNSSAASAIKTLRPKNDPSEFHLGCRVKHAQFGEWVVVSLKDDIAEIAFSSGPSRGIKKMNIRIAPVEKI